MAGFPVVVPVQFTFTRQVEIIYRTVQMTIEAIRCIDAYEKEGPFMLYVAYNAPHTPLQAQEKDIKLYTDNFDSLTPKEQKKATYSAMVSCMDRGIGAIVDALKKKGIMDNTFFIFFSDNGTAGVPGSSSGPLRGHKFDEWEQGQQNLSPVNSSSYIVSLPSSNKEQPVHVPLHPVENCLIKGLR